MSESVERPRILVAGDAAVPTGFARVIEGIFQPLVRAYEIHHLGTNYQGDPHSYDWKVYPAGIGGDLWGVNRLASLVERIRPALIFAVNDIWVLQAYMRALRAVKDAPPVVLYCPVGAGPVGAENIEPLAGVARCVAYTEFGRAQLEVAASEQRAKDVSFNFPSVDVIPHGVDTNVFHPIEAAGSVTPRMRARRLLFPNVPDIESRFIVLNANRNQPRKRIDTTIRAFAIFAKGKPANVNLFLHMGIEDIGWNLVTLARRYGVENRLLMSNVNNTMQGVSTERLNLIYNACDVGLNTSSGEGWGLPSFEHAATRAAQVVPRHTACAELWEDAGVLVEPALKTITERILIDAWLVTPEAVAEALERLYTDAEFLGEMSEKAYRNVTRAEYRWENIATRWDDLFREVIG